MSTFAVIASTLSAHELGLLVQKKYGLDKETSCTLLRTGMNHTYLVSGINTKSIFRVYSFGWRTKTEIAEEIKLLLLLKNNDLSVSYPIADINGAFIQEIDAPEGLRYAVLYSYAEGNKVRFIDKAACANVGVLMAQLHNVTANKTLKRSVYNNETLLEIPYQYAQGFFAAALPEMGFIRALTAQITLAFATPESTLITKGIVHMDIWYDNMGITDNNDITIFDFDFCGNGPFILDVAYFCKQLFHIEADKSVYEQKKAAFIHGYQSAKKLTGEELALIPLSGAACFIFYLGVQCKRFDWSNIFLTENYLKMYLGRIKTWIEYNANNKG